MSQAERGVLRLGLMRLTDAAPVVLAAADALFAEEGLEVALSVEPSWSNIADKLAFGLLDGAVMVPPLALAMTLGLRPAATSLVVPMSLSRNGNSVVVGRALATRMGVAGGVLPPAEAGGRLLGLIRAGMRPRLAVVHAWSTHDLLLRHWLSACGIDPEGDVTITVVPPSEMPLALAEGRIDGFCAGAPWSAVAAAEGVGRTLLHSSAIWPEHPEKCLALRADWAAREQAATRGVLRALLRAGARCGERGTAERLAGLLAGPAYVGVAMPLIRASLPGGEGGDVDRADFTPGAATTPWPAHAAWFTRQMARWSPLPDDAVARGVATYRPDLHRAAALSLGVALPAAPSPVPDSGGTGAESA